MSTIERNQWTGTEDSERTRQAGVCPVCMDRAGRDERVADCHGKEGRRYWHTDLPSYQQWCVEWSDGATQEVDTGHIYTVGEEHDSEGR